MRSSNGTELTKFSIEKVWKMIFQMCENPESRRKVEKVQTWSSDVGLVLQLCINSVTV